MYYIFGFLFLVFSILVITTIESTILLCYFHLCSEVFNFYLKPFWLTQELGLPLVVASIPYRRFISTLPLSLCYGLLLQVSWLELESSCD